MDITERKWVEQALRGASDELEAEVVEKNQKSTEASLQLRAEAAKRKEAEETLRRFGRSN